MFKVNGVPAARNFLLAKLPELEIHITDEGGIHTDMVVAATESEYHIEFGILDLQGRSMKNMMKLRIAKKY
jgi:hypothetical protein